jgi:uncharacterized LabA/DUF88 family protein
VLDSCIVADAVVFIDYQNVYNDARRAFYSHSASGTHGQIDPIRLGRLLCAKQPLGTSGGRNLTHVRVYRGRPDSTREPKTYGAHMRQCDAWEKAGATVIPRPLRYPHDWPNTLAEEKGIDVQIALDLVTMASAGDLDIAILCSTDTDLRPALEAFFVLPFEGPRTIEVAAWKAPSFKKALRLPNRHVWCHFLEAGDYHTVRDTRDYNIGRR